MPSHTLEAVGVLNAREGIANKGKDHADLILLCRERCFRFAVTPDRSMRDWIVSSSSRDSRSGGRAAAGSEGIANRRSFVGSKDTCRSPYGQQRAFPESGLAVDHSNTNFDVTPGPRGESSVYSVVICTCKSQSVNLPMFIRNAR